MKKAILFLGIVCLLVFVLAGYKITSELRTQKEEISAFNELAELIAESTNTQAQTEPSTEPKNNDIPNDTEPTLIISTRNLTPLFEQNSDCIGWVYIEGTAVDYPVMHTPDEPQRYLRKNFDKEYSTAGVPFLKGICTLNCDHLILYGHNMKNGTMFSDVTQYRNKEYYTEHPVIEFETAQGLKRYAVFAVVQVKKNDGWYAFHIATDKSEYDSKIAEIKSRSLYFTEITPMYGQQLITLSTCYGATKSDRIIVIGVEIHE